MKIAKQILKVVFISILLYSVIIILDHPHKEYYDTKADYVFSYGNAPDSVRSEIIEQLHKFQDGYTHRDTVQLKHFVWMIRINREQNHAEIRIPHSEGYGRKDLSACIHA